jgi:hypothetical protein
MPWAVIALRTAFTSPSCSATCRAKLNFSLAPLMISGDGCSRLSGTQVALFTLRLALAMTGIFAVFAAGGW